MENQFMFNKKVLAATMAVAITGGFVAESSAMEVATNDVGQVLLGSGYFTENDFNTEIAVVNTRTDAAVLAKVVFRSHMKSVEILDFLIWLSPGDVWRGSVSTNATTGLGHITSADDSVRNATDTSWGDTDALDVDFFAHNVTADGDSTTFGHFEIIGAYAAGAGTYSLTSGGTVTVVQGMSKDDLRTLFADEGLRAATTTQCTPAELNAANVWSATAPCSMEIMGETRIENATSRATYHPTALKNSTDNPDVTGYVNANPALTISTGAETLVGDGWGPAGVEWVQEVEKAIAANSSSWAWENGTDITTHAFVTFPTKYRHEGDTVAGLCGTNGTGGALASSSTTYSAPFQNDTEGSIVYTLNSFDNSENNELIVTVDSSISGAPTTTVIPDSLPNEVNYVVPAYFDGVDSGWAYYTWVQRTGSNCDYTGVPLTAYTYKFGSATGTMTAMDTMANK